MSETLIQPYEQNLIDEVDSMELEHPPPDEMAALALEQDEEIRAFAALPTPISADCSPRYKARRSSGRRPFSQIWWVVQHSTEGGTALGAAAWFANPDSAGSAHLCIDNENCFRTLDDAMIPWGAKGANYHGYHIENAGFAKWTSYIWSKQRRRELQRSAYKTALRCRWYKIPPRWVGASGLRIGVRGITTHNECTKAFGGSHWDPGPGFPKALYLTFVKGYYYGSLRKVKARA
jgi:N-acetylmuramoyl-L-alanine amidase